jgi:cell division protein FtsI/penicillin-binding protein 2
MWKRPSRPHYSPQPHLSPPSPSSIRPTILFIIVISAFLFIFGRFFFLQIVKSEELSAISRQNIIAFAGKRGQIYSSDGGLLVGNHYTYTIYIAVHKISDPAALYDQIAPIIQTDPEATFSLRPREVFLNNVQNVITNRAGIGNLFLASNVTQPTMEQLLALKHSAIEPERHLTRFYPEKTLAAHVLGYLSQDQGQGRYGIEGGRNKELENKTVQSLHDVDAFNNPINLSSSLVNANLDGRDLYLTINRQLQDLAEQTLSGDLIKYGATRGEIIILEPRTGKILALATNPSYDPSDYRNVPDIAIYKNPAVVDLFEPGSTFKVLTVAAGIDAGLINPDTTCPRCAGPRTIGEYTIKTWNNVYHPNISIRQALEKSDNTAMVYISDLLTAQRMKKYLQAFGIGEPLQLEIEEDVTNNFPQIWGPVETANRAFGQGVAVTSLQLLRAFSAIANDGKMMKPYLIEKSDDHTGNIYITEPVILGQVISPETAHIVADMMQTSAQHGEAQYLFKNTHVIAGKTGTAQIPEAGSYSDDTIASFIGFAPYNDPKFLMLVKFERPKSSIYAAETAAITWFQLAEKLFLYFNIN